MNSITFEKSFLHGWCVLYKGILIADKFNSKAEAKAWAKDHA